MQRQELSSPGINQFIYTIRDSLQSFRHFQSWEGCESKGEIQKGAKVAWFQAYIIIQKVSGDSNEYILLRIHTNPSKCLLEMSIGFMYAYIKHRLHEPTMKLHLSCTEWAHMYRERLQLRFLAHGFIHPIEWYSNSSSSVKVWGICCVPERGNRGKA